MGGTCADGTFADGTCADDTFAGGTCADGTNLRSKFDYSPLLESLGP